jgi:hypothetical protein
MQIQISALNEDVRDETARGERARLKSSSALEQARDQLATTQRKLLAVQHQNSVQVERTAAQQSQVSVCPWQLNIYLVARQFCLLCSLKQD